MGQNLNKAIWMFDVNKQFNVVLKKYSEKPGNDSTMVGHGIAFL
jgi:hypothetical protein